MRRLIHRLTGWPLVWTRFKQSNGDPLPPCLSFVRYDGDRNKFYAKDRGDRVFLEMNGSGVDIRGGKYAWRPYATRSQQVKDLFRIPIGLDVDAIAERLQ